MVKDCAGTIASHTTFAHFFALVAPLQALPFGSEVLEGSAVSVGSNHSWKLIGKQSRRIDWQVGGVWEAVPPRERV